MPTMSRVSTTPSSSNFRSTFDAALQAFENRTKSKLLAHPLATQLQSCDSPSAILSVLQDLIQQFNQRRSSDQRLSNWLNPTVNVLFAFSATLSEGVGLIFSPAKVIFAGVGVLLLAAKDVDASQEVLIDVFERIGSFFRRLESYTELTPSDAMTDVIVRIMVEVLSILAIMTTEIKQRRREKYLKKLLGRNDVEDALKRLDKLTQEEAQMAIVEVLKVTRNVDDKVDVLIDDGKEAEIKAEEEKRKKLRQALHKWLSPPDPSTNHNIARKAHHEGTAAWFLEGNIVKEWKSNPSLLWIDGKRTFLYHPFRIIWTPLFVAGSGKSVLCSRIIEDITALREAGTASLAYFYCDFRDEDKQSCRNMILSILSQLATQSNVCCDVLSQLYSAHGDGTRKPSDYDLKQCLKKILLVPSQGPIYLVVDALDECPNNSGMPTPREEALDFIEDLVNLHLPNLHICVTSRPEVDIRTSLEPLTSLRVSLHNQPGQAKDIADYVSSIVYSDKKMRRWRDDDKKLVVDTLSERADGMFRWVYCQLEILRHCLPPSIRGILDELPETLDETYECVLRGINKANREHALRLLHCLTVAIRPLRVEELAEVLAVDFDAANRGGIPKLNPRWRWEDQHQAVLSTCSSLITTVDDGDSQVVQFSHFSVKEFLTSDRLARSSGDVSRYHILLQLAHTTLAQACLGTLLRLDDGVNWVNSSDIPLARYAARYWVDHAQFEGILPCIQDAMEDLFDVGKPHFAAWLRLHDIDKGWVQFLSDWSMPDAQPLYYAALCGFYGLAKVLTFKHPEHVNISGGRLLTPLVAALRGEHFQIAELLLQHAADIHVRGVWERTILHAATRDGLVDTVRWLLNHGADVNAQQDNGWTPLHLAAGSSYLEVIRILIEHGADVNARSNNGEIPLHRAASPHDPRDQTDILQLLLDHGADVNARDNHGSTPLHYSSFKQRGPRTGSTRGTVEGTRLLLKHGAIIDAKNDGGKTPYQVALDAGHLEMAEFLLGCGVGGTRLEISI
ncbi:hypothetical protein BC827DRAFT_1170013 [Russula dissimulans]|nr:hypothetical protein BC827DRAFT_1170013 [Russula dissimulans]